MDLILAVEDNIETQLMLRRALEPHYQVVSCYTLEAARTFLDNNKVALVILDLFLPDGLGISLLSKAKGSHNSQRTPTIILSASTEITSKLEGLASGADDYVTKPFNNLELLARIEAVLRRGPARVEKSQLSIENLLIDYDTQSAKVLKGGEPHELELTPTEFKILTCLVKHYGTYLNRQELIGQIWGKTFITYRNVDTHVCKLRHKLKYFEMDILNKRNLGYTLSTPQKTKINQNVKSQIALPLSDSFELPAFGRNQHPFAQ